MQRKRRWRRKKWRRRRRRKRTEEHFCLQQLRLRRNAPALACSLITGRFFATSQAFNAALVGVQKCTSQHFDGTPAVKRELYWMQRNLKPTQTEGCAWDQRPGPEQVLDSRHTNTRAFEEYYRWLYSRLIKDLCQRHWVQEWYWSARQSEHSGLYLFYTSVCECGWCGFMSNLCLGPLISSGQSRLTWTCGCGDQHMHTYTNHLPYLCPGLASDFSERSNCTMLTWTGFTG